MIIACNANMIVKNITEFILIFIKKCLTSYFKVCYNKATVKISQVKKGTVIRMKKLFLSVVGEKSEPIIYDFTNIKELLEWYATSCFLVGNGGVVLVYDSEDDGGIGDVLVSALIDGHEVHVTTGLDDDRSIINVYERDSIMGDARKRIESIQFEQAEAEKEKALYNVSVYGKSLCFTGENAYNSVHDFILAVVSTEDDETGVITVEKDGRGLDIGYAKGKYNIFLRVSDDHCKWEIFEKGDRTAISKFIREWVIL